MKVTVVYTDIYYGAWADERCRMGSYMAYRPRSCDRREYIAESGVYISTAREYIAESGVYIWQSVITAAQRNGFCFAMEWPIPPSPQEPLPAL